MIRQNITLGDFIYITDLYKANLDNIDTIYKQYYMIRRQNLMNNISYDSDIYFIEKNIIDSCLDSVGKLDTTKLSSLIVYPIPNSKYSGYSTKETDFNDNFNEWVFRKYLDENGNDLTTTEIYDLMCVVDIENGQNIYEPADVITDMVRIYHPSLKAKTNAVIYMDNYINNIHFHYLCRTYDQFETHCETVFQINNQSYSEYIEFRIPNVETLFSLLDIDDDDEENQEKIKSRINDLKSYIKKYEEKINYTLNDLSLNIDDEDFEDIAPSYLKVRINQVKLFNEEIKSLLNNLNEFKNQTIYFKEITNIIDVQYYATDEYGTKKLVNKSLNYSNNDFNEINEVLDNDYEIINQKQSDKYIPLYLLLRPFFIERVILTNEYGLQQETEYYKKVYTTIDKCIENSYITFPINITIFPYNSIDGTGHFLLNENLQFNTDMFVTPCNITLSANLGFDESINEDGYENGRISIVGEFNFPYKEHFLKMFEGHRNQMDLALQKAYAKYHNLDIKYDSVNDTYVYGNYNGWLATEEDVETWQELSDIWEEFDPLTNIGQLNEVKTNSGVKVYKVNMVGLNIVLASDYDLNNIIYTQDFNINEIIGNFAFNLDGIFDKWEQLPQVLVAKISFIDRWLGNKINSNIVVINKEWFKYMINDASVFKLVIDTEKNDLIQNMDTSYINYINNINCIIKKDDSIQNQVAVNKNQTKIIYKPIFFKTVESQNVRLREGLTQNIGINLGDYMTKVNTFKIRISDNYIVESSRNNVYVIFKINAALFTSTSGTYDILSDDIYITSGSWSTY